MKKNGILIIIAVVIVLFFGAMIVINQSKVADQPVYEETIPGSIEVPLDQNGFNIDIAPPVPSSEDTNVGKEDCTKLAGAPVCGEDGNSYANSCIANNNNIKIKYQGECKPADQKKP